MIETILQRNSVRRYSEQPISQDDMELILKAAMAAPCSHDCRPWHFIVLSDKDLMARIGRDSEYAHMIEFADKAVVVCADESLSPNCWMLDCSAACENLLLAAQSLGIGGVWTAVYPYKEKEQKIKNHIGNIPDNIRILCVVPLGYPAKQARVKDKFDASRIHSNRW